MNTLTKIQNELVAPKGNKDQAGRFRYRTAEEICAALKPLLDKYEAAVWFSDELTEISGRTYIKTTLTYRHADTIIEVPAAAAIDFNHRGMSAEQCCGACMSYVHKYALGSLLLIDNEQDPDSLGPMPTPTPAAKPVTTEQRLLNLATALDEVKACTTRDQVVAVYHRHPELHSDEGFVSVCQQHTQELLTANNQ